MAKTEPVVKSIVICTGIIALTAIEIYALFKGINGILLSSVIGIIALAIGLKLPTPKILQ